MLFFVSVCDSLSLFVWEAGTVCAFDSFCSVCLSLTDCVSVVVTSGLCVCVSAIPALV